MTPRAATLSVVVLATLAASAGCPRYAPVEASTTTAAGGAGGQGGRGGAGGAGGQGGGSNSVCTKVCTTIFECGLIVDNGKPLCPGFSSGETKLEVFLSGDENVPGCVATCAENAALQTTDPSDDCAGAITTLKGFYPPFKKVCDGGAASGAGGGGGAG